MKREYESFFFGDEEYNVFPSNQYELYVLLKQILMQSLNIFIFLPFELVTLALTQLFIHTFLE
jgi:hypothetical protein